MPGSRRTGPLGVQVEEVVVEVLPEDLQPFAQKVLGSLEALRMWSVVMPLIDALLAPIWAVCSEIGLMDSILGLVRIWALALLQPVVPCVHCIGAVLCLGSIISYPRACCQTCSLCCSPCASICDRMVPLL